MRVNPQPPKLGRHTAEIHLLIEELGHGLIVEGHRCPRACLPHELHVLDVEQIVSRTDPKAADFSITQVA